MNERTETEMSVMDKALDSITTVGAKAAVKATNVVGRLMTTRRGRLLLAVPLAVSCLAVTASAEGGSDAAGMLGEIMAQLQKWIPVLGGLLVIVGGIQLGIGFKDDDSTGKTRGMQCMIGGAIVAAIGGMIDLTIPS